METEERTLYLLEEKQVFSKSLIWDIQQRYYTERGVDAWRTGDVPHYVTTNPRIANSYAEIVFAFYNDRLRFAPETADEPVYICELGSGPGRFAFHFLNRLQQLCELSGVAVDRFRYVLTDLAESNLSFWKSHSHFQSFFESGVLDYALFDVNHTATLHLQHSGQTISAGDLAHPLIAIANYLFDTVPQEQFYFNEGKAYLCLLSIASDKQPLPERAADLMTSMHYRYDYRELPEVCFDEPALQEIFDHYRRTVSDRHVLFPVAPLQCMTRLRALSQTGLMLLTSDKGDHRMDHIQYLSAQGLIYHGGCFSVSVNYHAFEAYFAQQGGFGLFPERACQSITTGCLLMMRDMHSCPGLQRTFQREIVDFGPDDFYLLSSHLLHQLESMTFSDILSLLRLGHFDGQLFLFCLPRLTALSGEMSATEIKAVKQLLDAVWSIHFPLGEAADLPWFIATLCYSLNDYPKALFYFEKSLDIYGPFTGTLSNMAASHLMLHQPEQAAGLLKQILDAEPDNESAKRLLREVEQLSTTADA